MIDLPLVIRADAGVRMGSGHLMRCIGLGQAWQRRGGSVHFVTACESDGLIERLRAEQFDVTRLVAHHPDESDWAVTADILNQHPTAPVVLDGYHFDLVYQNRVKAASHLLLLVDDFAHRERFEPDILLNQNIDAAALAYNVPRETRCLLGTAYALLRSEFLAWGDGEKRPFSPTSQNILVTLGGSDPDNQTLKVIEAIDQMTLRKPAFADPHTIVVIGATNPHREQLQQYVDQMNGRIELRQNVTNMPELMNWADLAVCAGGSTCWEFAFMGVPMLIVVIADNQVGLVDGLEQAQAAINLGWFEQVTSAKIGDALSSLLPNTDKRKLMCEQAKRLVDGKGAERVVQQILEAVKVKTIEKC